MELIPQPGWLHEEESIGGAADAIHKEMIRETVREHFRKEAMLRARNIKVLSLFFVDRVAGLLGDGTNNEDASGDFVRWVDGAFAEERGKNANTGNCRKEDYERSTPGSWNL